VSKIIFVALSVAALLLTACESQKNAVPDEDHGGLAVTIWTDRTELFAEFPPLIANHEALVALHLTDLEKFGPVTEGRVTVIATASTGSRNEFSLDRPSSIGIYRIPLNFPAAGKYRLQVVVSNNGSDTVVVDGVNVVNSESELHSHGGDPATSGSTGFLKEQQWKTDFRCEVVKSTEIKGTLESMGEIIPRVGSETVVAAPFSGYCPVSESAVSLSPGTRVNKGSILVRMIPSVETQGGSEDFGSRLAGARAARDNARNEFERARQLFSNQIISKKDFQAIEAEWSRATASYDALSSAVQSDSDENGHAPGSFIIRAPMSGILTRVHVMPGKPMETGEPLFEIVDTRRLWLRTHIPMTELSRFSRPSLAAMQLPGNPKVHVFEAGSTRRISEISMIDERTRSLPVIFEVSNSNGLLILGMTGRVQLTTDHSWSGFTIPETALMEDQGQYFVFVQIGGESFERREVRLGCRQGEKMEITSGLNDGDRVVTVGAAQVRLASSASSVPAHGHAH
jgi:RND family efflux transporter MFP subunit